MLTIEVTILASAAVIATMVIDRVFLWPKESAMKPRVRDQSPTVSGDPGHGRPDRVRGTGVGVQGLGNAVDAGTTRAPTPQIDAFMPVSEHIERFIAWAIVGVDGRTRRVRQRVNDMHDLYLEWCACHYVMPIPEKTWQTQMKRHEQVEWKREPMKCPATGRILRKPSGAPERETYYTMKPPRMRPVLPGKVPVGELVAAQPLPSKSERDASRKTRAASVRPDELLADASVAQSATAFEQPFRRVA